MKILLISNKSPWPARDGGSAATMNMISGLASSGASVTVLSLNTLKHHADTGSIPADFAGKVHLVTIDPGFNLPDLISNFLFSDKPYILTRFQSAEFEKKLISVINDDFDIIQVEGLAMTLYLPLIRSLTKSKIVYRPHNVENLIWKQLADEEKNMMKRYYLRSLAERLEKTEQNIINSFDALAAMTGRDLEWFIRSGIDIPHFVSAPGIPFPSVPYKDVTNRTIFFIGALDWRPNINGLRWFIRYVYPLVLNSLPDASFHIAGRNPSREVINMCRRERIIFHGEVESSEEFINDKAVMAVPLFSGSGIRMKILEGMRMGKPVVATSVAAGGIEYENNKNIHIADDASGFAGQLINLLLDASLRNATGSEAMENVRKNYNIFVSADNLLKFYSQLF